MRSRNLDQPKGMLKIVEVNREHADDPGTIHRIKFVIGGAPRVKKNTQRSVGFGKSSRRINSAAYTNWERFASPQLDDVMRQYRRMTGQPWPLIDFTHNFSARFFMDTKGQVDRANPRIVIEITRKAPESWQKFD